MRVRTVSLTAEFYRQQAHLLDMVDRPDQPAMGQRREQLPVLSSRILG